MNTRFLFSILLVIFSTSILFGKSDGLSKKGEKQWFYLNSQASLKRYDYILPHLEKLVQSNPDFIKGRKLLAETYIYTQQFDKAAPFIKKSIETYKLNDKYWWQMSSDANRAIKNYPEAINSLKSLLKVPALGLPYQKLTEEKIKQLEYTWFMIQNPVPFQPIQLGNEVNTPAFELYPFLSPDGEKLYFTRKERNEELFQAEKVNGNWNNVKELSFNTDVNEGAQSVSADGKLILFTACNYPNGLGSCDIFYSFLVNGTWTTPNGIGAPINSTDWESQPSISANGMAILFSSNRPGGKGGKDLYISYLNKENKWLEPQNLGDVINTPFDEETPFLHADGRSLYFSSNGHSSIGGKDIFVSRLSDNGKWSEPVNLGYPINTEKDESSIYVELDGKSAYLASEREGGQGKLDLYQFVLHDSVRSTPSTFVNAIVSDIHTKAKLDVEYSIFNFENNQIFSFGQTKQDGEFLICMPVNKTYRLEITKPGYMFYSEQFLTQSGSMVKPYVLEVKMQPIALGANIILKNILFKTDSYELGDLSFPELQKIIELMNANKNIKAIVKGHTDNIGSSNYNLELSQKRAQSVVDYLLQNGIAADRLSAKGMGASQPISTNDTEEGRLENRRTEFQIVEQ
ncbi:MAG: OmpA family protein [Chitinophagales bacterium]|nr:OmpA family protein [Chitinophagales bacterium]